MKYEVIGWTECTTQKYPEHETITASVDAAIIKELKDHGYMFGGDMHEYYCPILNDGTFVSYSWRGWGRIIALANDDDDYMLGYMNMLINPDYLKYPDDLLIEDNLIVPRETLAEVLVMRLSDDMFEAVKNGTKTVEIRLFDEKRKHVDIGDYIDFRKLSDETQRVLMKVTDLRLGQSFEEIFREYDFKRGYVLRYPPEALGSPANADCRSLVKGMYKYYTKEQEEKYGVIAIELEKPKHCCTTYLGIWTETFTFEDKILSITEDFEQFDNWFRIGFNEEYDTDVNVMLRKTLKDLFGKEERLKDVFGWLGVPITLEIYATVIEDSDEPKQNLTIDKDVTDFLQKSGIELKLQKRVI